MARIGFKEYHRKITERIKGRFKKKCKYNWPELDQYCGCCSLSTGIYIRTTINLVVSSITIIWNTNLLSHIMGINPMVFSTNLTINEYHLTTENLNLQQDLARLHLIYNGVVTYYILWLCYKFIYLFILLWTFFAIFKRNGKMIKILLIISVPNWLLDIYVSLLAALLISLTLRLVLLLDILFEGYNILALSSEYKKIMGKSRVRHKDVESDAGTPNMTEQNINLQYGYNQIHCTGCNCTLNEPPDNGNGVVTIQPSADPIQTTLIANKEIDENELNYAITGILNPRNSEDCNTNETAGNASGQQAVRPRTLDLTLNMVKDEKVVITDEPIIYDVNQLNVGTSPVVEDREKEADGTIMRL